MSESFIGEIRIFAGNYAPVHWALCAGQSLPINQNGALFSLFGTLYGGDGITDFNLPDMRGRIPLHQGQGAGLNPHSIGEKNGMEKVTLEVQHLPEHNHSLMASADLGTENSPAGNIPAKSHSLFYDQPTQASKIQQLVTGSIAETGGDPVQPHDNMMPFLCMNFIVALTGQFPSRN